MKIIEGNIMDITKGIIIHQVNNKHVMGAGLAKQIRAKYPQHYDDYMRHDLEMGSIVPTLINKKFGIMGFVAQRGYGRGQQFTVYSKFLECLSKLKTFHEHNPNILIHMPVGIGCGLAGGSWDLILSMLEIHTPFVILIKLKGGEQS